jgi:hypothetical protein
MDCQAIYNEAMKAGLQAGNEHQPTPMIVAQIIIKPATCQFVRYLKSKGIGHKSYYGGWSWWVSQFGLSMEQKEKFAYAAADVLNKYGIKCYATSRMD